FHYGDAALPESPTAGLSCQTISIASAVQAATEALHQQLVDLVTQDDGPLAGSTIKNTEFRDGGMYRTDDRTRGERFAAILRRAGRSELEAQASAPAPVEMMKYSMASYGAQFCEVRVGEHSGEVRVSRWIGSF